MPFCRHAHAFHPECLRVMEQTSLGALHPQEGAHAACEACDTLDQMRVDEGGLVRAGAKRFFSLGYASRAHCARFTERYARTTWWQSAVALCGERSAFAVHEALVAAGIVAPPEERPNDADVAELHAAMAWLGARRTLLAAERIGDAVVGAIRFAASFRLQNPLQGPMPVGRCCDGAVCDYY